MSATPTQPGSQKVGKTVLNFRSLVFVTENHPGDADAQAEGREQQHGDVRPLLQVRQVVLRDPGIANGTAINKCERKPFQSIYQRLLRVSLTVVTVTHGMRLSPTDLWFTTKTSTLMWRCTCSWTHFNASHLHLQNGSLRTKGHRQLWRPTEEATQKMAMTQMAEA